MQSMSPKLGAHLSIAGGYSSALQRVVDIGGNCLQIFSSSPRGWNFAKVDDEQTKLFKQSKLKLQIDPVYFHASYLINLADDERIGQQSKLSLIAELSVAEKIGVKGSIVHLGSFKDESNVSNESYKTDVSNPKYKILIRNIKEVLDKTPKSTLLMIENAGNRKIGRTLEEIQLIISDVNNSRLKICLDTCHLYSTGYSLKTRAELDSFLAILDQYDLYDLLELWHFNDSKDPFASLHDRHENIGQGSIGLEEFKIIMNHPKTKNFSFIIETPGFDQMGPDKKNLDILKSLV